MGLTIGLTQLKRKKRKDGRIPIYIRITEDRKSRYRSTGIAVKKSDWNNNKKQVSGVGDTEDLQLNIELKKQLNDVEGIKRELYKRDSLSMAAILNELSEDTDTRSILHQAKEYKQHLKDDDRYWEQRHFTVVINNLTAFIDDTNSSDRLDQLDSDWITGFQSYLLKNVGNANNTVRKKMQRFKSMVTWLIKTNEIKNDPFTTVERVQRERSNSKVKLTFAQIEAIKNLKFEHGSDLWHVRNYFMYSFYNAGIRFGDMCCLKWDNIIDGRLVYNMNKTGGKKSINQLQPMYRILWDYVPSIGQYLSFTEWTPEPTYYLEKPKNTIDNIIKSVVIVCSRSNRNRYIFPILQKDYTDPNELRKRISSNNVIVNRHLKTIAIKAGIQANISFHVSRHSFAHYALKKGMDVYAISKALGHSDLKITQQYLKTFDEELLDNSMNELF